MPLRRRRLAAVLTVTTLALAALIGPVFADPGDGDPGDDLPEWAQPDRSWLEWLLKAGMWAGFASNLARMAEETGDPEEAWEAVEEAESQVIQAQKRLDRAKAKAADEPDGPEREAADEAIAEGELQVARARANARRARKTVEQRHPRPDPPARPAPLADPLFTPPAAGDTDPRIDEAKRLLDEAEEIIHDTDDLDAARDLIDQARDLIDEVARDRDQAGPPDPSRPDGDGQLIDYVNVSIETAERHLDEAQKARDAGQGEPNPFERYIRGDQGGQDKTGETPGEGETPPAEEETPPPDTPEGGDERKDPDAQASLGLRGETWEQERNPAGTPPAEWTEANEEPITHPPAITTAAGPVPATAPLPGAPAEPEPDDWAARLQEQPVDPRPTAAAGTPEPAPVSPIRSPAIGPGTSAVELLLGGKVTATPAPEQPDQPALPQVAPVLGPGGVLGLQVTPPMPDQVVTTDPGSVKDLLDLPDLPAEPQPPAVLPQPADQGLSGTRTTPGQPAEPDVLVTTPGEPPSANLDLPDCGLNSGPC